MRRSTLLLSLVLLLGLLAAACGADDSPTETTSDTSDDATDDDTPAATDLDAASDDEPIQIGPYPIADLSFAVDLGDGGVIEYRLACLGDTATFTGTAGDLDAAAACLALNDDDVRERLTTDIALDRMCTEIFGGPEVAQITGTLDEMPVDAGIDRANGCGIDDWDRLLTSMLPASVG